MILTSWWDFISRPHMAPLRNFMFLRSPHLQIPSSISTQSRAAFPIRQLYWYLVRYHARGYLPHHQSLLTCAHDGEGDEPPHLTVLVIRQLEFV